MGVFRRRARRPPKLKVVFGAPPTVQNVSVDPITATAAVVAPGVSRGIPVPPIAATAVVVAPGVAQGVPVPAIAATAAVVAPGISRGIPVPSISASAVITAPGISRGIPVPPITATAVINAPVPTAGVTEVTRHAITWTFTYPVTAGEFANGDQYVVELDGNPVEVASITRPGSADGRDGSMINPSRVEAAGFDDRHEDYDSGLNVALSLPLELSPGDSLVSTISDPDGHPPGGPVKTWIEHASVLTCLASAPAANTLRPCFWGTTKTIYSADDINDGILPSLEPTASAPTLASVVATIERLQLDHRAFEDLNPHANMPDYGREIARNYGDALAMACCDAGEVGDKTELLIHICQMAIDIAGAVADPGSGAWNGDGSHNHGRLAVLILGALLLDEVATFVPTLADGLFQEWDQVFRVVETSPGVYNNGNGGYDASHDLMPEWAVRHHDAPELDSVAWTANYRQTTGLSWWGHALVLARVPGALAAWQEGALFLEYVQRYNDVQGPRSADPGTYPGEEGYLTNSDFAWEMWDAYSVTTQTVDVDPIAATAVINAPTIAGAPSIAELRIQVETLSDYELTDDLVRVSPDSLVETDIYWEGWSLFSTFGIRTVVRKESDTLAHGVVSLVYGHNGNAAALASILTKQTLTLKISYDGGGSFADTGVALDTIAGAVQHGQHIPPLYFAYNPTTGARIGDFYVGSNDYNTQSNICIFDPVQGGYGDYGRHALRYDPARDDSEQPGRGFAWNRTKVAGLFMYQGAFVRANGTYRTPAQDEQWMMGPNGYANESFKFAQNYDIVHITKNPIWSDQKFRTNGWRQAPDLQWMDAGVGPACMEIERDPAKWRDPFYQVVVRQAAARWLSMIAPPDQAWTGPYHGRYWEGAMRQRGRILLAGVVIWRCLYKIQALRDYSVAPEWLDMATTMATRMEEIVARQWANYVWSDTEPNTWVAWRRINDGGRDAIVRAHPELAPYAESFSERAWWESGWWSHGLIWWIETVALFGPIDFRAVQMLKRICIENLDQFYTWAPHPFDPTNTSYQFGGWRQAYAEYFAYWKHPVTGTEYDFRPQMLPNDNIPPNTLNAVMQIGVLLGWISGTKANEVVTKTTRVYRWDWYAKPAALLQVVQVLPIAATAVVNAPGVIPDQLVEVPAIRARAVITGAGVNGQIVSVPPITAYALEATMLGEEIEVLRGVIVEVPPITAYAYVTAVGFPAQEVTVPAMIARALITEPVPDLQVVFVDAIVARALITEPTTDQQVVQVPAIAASAVVVAPSSSAVLARCFAVDIDLLGNRMRNAGGIEIGMTQDERDAILAPRDGTVIFNLDTGVLNVFHGAVWVAL